jgi:predicted short-subunit dehydrogenase-like oxidoreductase (DUF2520 family)
MNDIEAFRILSGRLFLRNRRNMMTQNQNAEDAIAILGLGKVGTAVGHLLKSAGYRIVAVADQSPAALQRGIAFTGGQACATLAEAAAVANCIIITTTDDAIASVCIEIVAGGAVRMGDKVIHMSGAGGLDLVAPARQAGAHVASIHPIQSFADVEGAIMNIPGSTFGITADEKLREWAVSIVNALKGVPFFVTERDKALYHAAACMASNYLTTLMHMVETTYQALGLSRKEAIRAFWPLVRGTLLNIETRGAAEALTGPIARGDAGTIGKHLQALQETLPGLLNAYCELGLMTVDMALQKGSLTRERAQTIKTLFKEGGSADEYAGKSE